MTENYSLPLEVTAKRSAGFYFAIILILIAHFGLFGFGILAIAFAEPQPSYVLIFVGIAAMVFGIYSIRVYYHHVPGVKVNSSGIEIAGNNYSWADIEQISFTGKQSFRYLGTHNMEGAKIVFKDGTNVSLFDGMYANLWQVKALIRQSLAADTRYEKLLSEAGYPALRSRMQLPAGRATASDASLQMFQYFKGIQFTNFMGILLWAGLLCIIVGILAIGNTAATVLFCMLAIGWFFLWSFRLNYFGISEDYLIIRNHNFFWKKIVYRLADIEQVVLDSPGKSSNSLTLILNTMETKTHMAPTLRSRHWIALMQLLQAKHIKVKDENHFVEMQKPAMKKVARKMYIYLILYFVVSTIIYMYVASLNVSERLLILLKLLWFVLSFVAVIWIMRIVAKSAKEAQNEG